MKQVLGGAMLIAMLSAGCSYETGAEGTEGEHLGSISEALTVGDWLPTFLAPYAPMRLPDNASEVCRPMYNLGHPAMPGYYDGAGCHYAYNGFAYHSPTWERVEKTGLSWVSLGKTCGASTCEIPGIKAKIVGTADWGICAVEVGGMWRAGHINENNACYTAPLTGGQYRRTAFSTKTKVLIRN